MPCYSQDNVPEGYIAKFPDGPSYESEEDCLDACAEGACCEIDGTCNIKPQCECDTDNGAVFAGVGEGCERCNYCACDDFNLGPTVTVNIKDLAFTTNPSYQPRPGETYDVVNANCNDDDILSQADTGPFTFEFYDWLYWCNNTPPLPLPSSCWGPLWTQYPTYELGGGEFPYDPEQKNFLRYICLSTDNRRNGLLSFQMQTALFGKLPCQEDYSTVRVVGNYFLYGNWAGGGFVPSEELFCRLMSGETVAINTSPPNSGAHVVLWRNSSDLNNGPNNISQTERYITCTIELSLNPLP